MDRSTGKFTRFQNIPGNDSTLGNNIVLAIVEDDKNILWIGNGNNGGISKLNRKTETFDQFLIGLSITNLYVDTKSILWVGTLNGLYKYDIESNEFVDININATVISIIEDDDYNLWIASPSGIIQLNENREHLIVFGKENGVTGTGHEVGRIYKKRNGNLMLATMILKPIRFTSKHAH